MTNFETNNGHMSDGYSSHHLVVENGMFDDYTKHAMHAICTMHIRLLCIMKYCLSSEISNFTNLKSHSNYAWILVILIP